MFTGIIKEVGVVSSVQTKGDGLRLAVKTQTEHFKDVAIDESININGACQTVVRVNKNIFEVDTIEETLRKTTFGTFQAGQKVNLERAVRASDRLGGHIVQGHVDCVGRIESIKQNSASWSFHISFDHRFEKLIVPVGSITVDGISLTVASIDKNIFQVAVIPYTFANTIFDLSKSGDSVNLEFDILGKYIARMLSHSDNPESDLRVSKITEDWLRGQGY